MYLSDFVYKIQVVKITRADAIFQGKSIPLKRLNHNNYLDK